MNAAEIPITEQRLVASAMHMGYEQLHKQTDAAMLRPRLLCTKNSQKQPLEECKGGPDKNQQVTKFESGMCEINARAHFVRIWISPAPPDFNDEDALCQNH